jgi:hypothetical protein
MNSLHLFEMNDLKKTLVIITMVKMTNSNDKIQFCVFTLHLLGSPTILHSFRKDPQQFENYCYFPTKYTESIGSSRLLHHV